MARYFSHRSRVLLGGRNAMRPKKALVGFPDNNVVSFLLFYTTDLIWYLKKNIKNLIINVILYYSSCYLLFHILVAAAEHLWKCSQFQVSQILAWVNICFKNLTRVHKLFTIHHSLFNICYSLFIHILQRWAAPL